MSDTQAGRAAPERKLATIVAADVAGYSRIMGDNEEVAIGVLRGHRDVYESLLGLHRGRLFNTAGDAFLSEFPSAVDAVRFATELQSAIRTRNDQLPAEQRMLFRIGVNIGDVVVQGGDLLGDGVNVAARVQTSAEPGGICISGAVFDQIQNKLMLSIQSLGERDYKNLSQPVRTYTIAQAEAGSFPTPPRRAAGGSRRGQWLIAACVAALLVGGGGWWLYESAQAQRAEQARLQSQRAAEEAAQRKAAADRLVAERQVAEESRRRAEEDRLRADAERKRLDDDRRRADEERQRADADRERRAADEARLRVEDERRRAEAQRLDAERQKLETERRATEEERHRIEEERRRAELQRLESERKAAEEARSRAEEERRRAEAQRLEAERRAAEERQRAEAQRKAAEDPARRAAVPPPQSAAAPPQTAAAPAAPGGAGAARFDGRYVGRFCSAPYGQFGELCWNATVMVANGVLSGQFSSGRSGGVHTYTGSVTAAGAVDVAYEGVSTQVTPGTPARGRMRGTISNNVMEMTGQWLVSNRGLSGRFVRQE